MQRVGPKLCVVLTCKRVKAQAEGVAHHPAHNGHKGDGKQADLHNASTPQMTTTGMTKLHGPGSCSMCVRHAC
jgi:hypothetical protein